VRGVVVTVFARRVSVTITSPSGERRPALLRHIDNFAMRNFTNDAIFDDTLPLADGLMEIGNRVPVERLASAMEDWFRRKGYLGAGESRGVVEMGTVV